VDSRAGLEVDVLVQEPELHATRAYDVATIRRLIASDETKDRALAGAVAADEPNVLAPVDLQGGTTQNILSAVGFINV